VDDTREVRFVDPLVDGAELHLDLRAAWLDGRGCGRGRRPTMTTTSDGAG